MPLVRALLTLMALPLAPAGALAWFSGSGWPLELFSHFRMHYLALSLLLAGLLALCGGRRAAFLALFAGALNLPHLAPHLGLPAPQSHALAAPAPQPGRVVTLITVNLLADKRALDAFRDYVRETRPDAFLMTEIPWDAWQDYDASFPEYRWRLPTGRVVTGARTDAARFEPGLAPGGVPWINSGSGALPVSLLPHGSDRQRFKRSLRHVALFSRFPVARAYVLWAEPPATPVLVAELRLGPCVRPLTLVGLHAFAPMTRRDMAHRDRAIRLAAGAARNASGPSVMLGDMNATPWSPILREVTRSGLGDSGRGRVTAATWSRRVVPPALARLPFVGLPIDHVFVSPEIGIAARRTGPFIGSDHRPLLVRLSVPVMSAEGCSEKSAER